MRQPCTCMDVQESESNWPEMRKPLGKPLVLQRRGQEPNNLRNPSENRGFKTSWRKIRRTQENRQRTSNSRQRTSKTNFLTSMPIYRFTGFKSDCDLISVSIRHGLAAWWMDSGRRESRGRDSDLKACSCSGKQSDNSRPRCDNLPRGSRETNHREGLADRWQRLWSNHRTNLHYTIPNRSHAYHEAPTRSAFLGQLDLSVCCCFECAVAQD